MDPSKSPDENIRRLCYDPDGYLFKDFDRIFEVKRMRRIGKSVQEDVQEKLRRLKLPRGKSVTTVLVYAGEIDPALEEDGARDLTRTPPHVPHQRSTASPLSGGRCSSPPYRGATECAPYHPTTS